MRDSNEIRKMKATKHALLKKMRNFSEFFVGGVRGRMRHTALERRELALHGVGVLDADHDGVRGVAEVLEEGPQPQGRLLAPGPATRPMGPGRGDGPFHPPGGRGATPGESPG